MEVVYGHTEYYIDSVDSLIDFQNMLTRKFFEENDANEKVIIDKYFGKAKYDYDTRKEIENYVIDIPEICDGIIEAALSGTDYDDIDSLTEDLDSAKSALEEIYNMSREWI